MQIDFSDARWHVDSEGEWLLLKVGNHKQAIDVCQMVKEKPCECEIKHKRKKRSLDANAYCFTLIDKLAAKLHLPKEQIYRMAIKEISGNSDMVCVQDKAVEKLRQGWESRGLGWQTDTMPSKIDGCTNVILYYGSSVYDVAQMNELINNITEACTEEGIDVRTPDEIARMVDLWGRKNG